MVRFLLVFCLFFSYPVFAYDYDEVGVGDRVVEEGDKDKKKRKHRRRGSVRGKHRDFDRRMRSLTPEQRKALRQEKKRHREAMREILGGDDR